MKRSEPALRPVELPVAHWLVIDAVLDNEAAVEARTGDEGRVVELAHGIREAGWAALPDWPQDEDALAAWPRPGRTVTMALTDPQWRLVLDALDRWADEPEEPDATDEDSDGGADLRAIAAQLRPHLTGQA
jgi:hypothetical protein